MAYDTEHETDELRLAGPTPIRQLAVQVGTLWWVPLVVGLLSVGFGLAVLASDWTVKALVVVTGLALVVRGLGLVFDPSYAAARAAEQVVAGLVGVVVGIVLVAWPEPTLLVLAVALGAWLAVSGGFHVVACISRRRQMAHWGVGVAVGVVELLLGLWVMRRPDVTVSLVITVIGLWAVITGVIFCVQAFEIRAAARELTAGEPR